MSARLQPPVGPGDHALGRATAPVTLVEYGDLQCPFCAGAHPVIEAIREKLGDQLRFVFRHFPLTEVHREAMLAAEACEAAADQRPDAFWSMQRHCFRHQRALGEAQLVAGAGALGLDVERFTMDLRTHRFRERVTSQLESGLRSGVNGTPTFFINGDRFHGDWDAGYLMKELRRALGQVGATAG